jgi:hypothetical protein
MRFVGAAACLIAMIDFANKALSDHGGSGIPSWVLWLYVVFWFGWFLAFIFKNDLNT